jgi:hypothetical protein
MSSWGGAADGWRIAAQRSPGHVPPRWPDPAYPQQFHLDVTVDDINAAEAAILKLGATWPRSSTNSSQTFGRRAA